jgi:hypothetical protein
MSIRKHPASKVHGTLVYHKFFEDMTPQEGMAWIASLRARLLRKQQRERAYLDRRAARGTHTPTDEAYENDQVLESELITFLDELAERLAKEIDR